jgi:hypothetical protein
MGNDFLNRTQMTQQPRKRIDKWDFMNLESFCTTKEMITRLKSLPTEWEKVFVSYMSDKGLITRTQGAQKNSMTHEEMCKRYTYTAMKKNETLSFASEQMELGNIF